VVGHDGIGGAEGHDELAAALGEGAEVGVLGVEIGRELGVEGGRNFKWGICSIFSLGGQSV
jgi:hypothetical protein